MKLEKILCYRFEMKTDSPLSIGGSYSYNTDHDIITSNNIPFVPASSIMGCIFAKEDPDMFGVLDLTDENVKAKSSNLFVSDGYFLNDTKMTVRDGNKLDANKIAENTGKFNAEAIHNNQVWNFFIEYRLFDDSIFKEEDVHKTIMTIASKLNNGYYRIGYKQNRGFGKQKDVIVYKKVFDRSNYKEYADFDGYLLKEDKMVDYGISYNETEISLSVDIQLITPLCIRDYSTVKGEPDYGQIKGLDDYNKENLAVVPATSLNGALQADVRRLAEDLGITLSENDKGDIYKYVLDEIYLEGSFMIQSRNAINRFSSGTKDGALFKEEIFVPNDKSIGTINLRFRHDNLKIIALYYLAINDINQGYLSIGGSEAIGRGVFKNTSDISIKNVDKSQLIQVLKGGK